MYKYIIGDSCCNGYKILIYKLNKNGDKTEAEKLENYQDFDTKEEAKNFAENRIKQIEEENNGGNTNA